MRGRERVNGSLEHHDQPAQTMESIMIKSVASFLLVFLTAGVAMAADGGASAGGWAPIGIGLAIGLAFVESLVLFCWVLCFLQLG